MSCDHEWARCSGKNASYLTVHFVLIHKVDWSLLDVFSEVSLAEGKMEENIDESMMRTFVHQVFRKSDNIG